MLSQTKVQNMYLNLIVSLLICNYVCCQQVNNSSDEVKFKNDQNITGNNITLDVYTISNQIIYSSKYYSLDSNYLVCVYTNENGSHVLTIYATRIKNHRLNSSPLIMFKRTLKMCKYVEDNYFEHSNNSDFDLMKIANIHNLIIDDNKKLLRFQKDFIRNFPFFNSDEETICYNMQDNIKNENELLYNSDNRSGIVAKSDNVKQMPLNRRELDKYIICFGLSNSGFQNVGSNKKKLSLFEITLMYGQYFQDMCYIHNVGVILFVSSFLMTITVLVYCILPSLRSNVYGKCVVLYLVTMIVAFTSFASRLIFAGKLGPLCEPAGFIFQFAWISSFTWQSVMCFDILLALSVLRWRVSLAKGGELKKLLLYCLYAYGLPAVITLTTVFLQFGPLIDSNSPWKPNIGGEYCFFQNSVHSAYKARWLYFCGPYSIIIVINVVMFVVTAVLIHKHSQPANSFKDSNSRCTFRKRDKELFQVHLNLFFVMGTNWILEVVGVIKDNAGVTSGWVFRMIDYFNASIGAVLFLVLVCKGKVASKLKKKIMGKPSKKRTSNTSQIEDISISSVNIKPSTSNDTNVSNVSDFRGASN